MKTGKWTLDRAALLEAIEQRRKAHGHTWEQVRTETGLAVATFSRLRNGRDVTASTLATITAYLGHELPYTKPGGKTPEPSNMDPLF